MAQTYGQAQGGAMAAAPPPPPMVQWHVATNGQSSGPMSPPQLQSAIASGQVTESTMVWCAGMSAWQPAGQVPQLAGSFGPPPPPPPPPAL